MRKSIILPMIALVLSVAISGKVRASESMPELDGFLPEVVEKVGTLPEPAPGEEIVIADAIEMAAERNTSLEVMKAEVERSRWQTATAWAIIMPMVEASASYVRADHEDVVEFDMSSMLEALGIPVPEGTTSEPTVIRRLDNLNGSLSVSMSLINVAGWYTIAAAQSGDKLARLTYEQVRDQIQSGVVQAFLAAMMTRSVIDLQKSQVISAAHHLDFALKKFAAGSGLKIDVVRAEADLVKARQELLNANLAYESARDALGILTG
ncbi:MAG TPA: TolC family protein, partial [Myxococcota bacterium]|nr:TolC family protein [Myxococcota bacterium]